MASRSRQPFDQQDKLISNYVIIFCTCVSSGSNRCGSKPRNPKTLRDTQEAIARYSTLMAAAEGQKGQSTGGETAGSQARKGKKQTKQKANGQLSNGLMEREQRSMGQQSKGQRSKGQSAKGQTAKGRPEQSGTQSQQRLLNPFPKFNVTIPVVFHVLRCVSHPSRH